MHIRHFAAPSHLPSLLSFPRFHHRQGNLQSSTHGQQTLNRPPLSPWSPPPAHNDPYTLSPPATDRYLAADPTTDAVHPLFCWTHLAVLQTHIVQTRLVSTAIPCLDRIPSVGSHQRRGTSIGYLAREQSRTRTRTRTSTRQGQGAASHCNTSIEARHRQAGSHLQKHVQSSLAAS